MVSIISHVSIKRTVCIDFHMTLLKVQYNLRIILKRNKRTVSNKRTLIFFSHANDLALKVAALQTRITVKCLHSSTFNRFFNTV